MKRGFFAGLILLCSLVTAMADEAPHWVTKEQDVWVEGGIIYARGSARIASVAMSVRTSETRARSNISDALANNAISGYSPIPADTKEPTTFNVNGVSGTFGDTTTVDRYIAEDGTVFTLLSCTGAELEQ